MPKWEIRDWTNKLLFGGKTFDSFEDGWSFIYEASPEPDRSSPDWVDGWYDDFYVVAKPPEHKRLEFTVTVKVPVVWNDAEDCWEIAEDEVEVTDGGGLNDYEREGAWVPDAGDFGEWMPNDSSEQADLHSDADRYVHERLKGAS